VARSWRCEVSDDGRGGGADESGGTGILGLRDRAEAAGGTLSMTSLPGRGTVVADARPLTPRRPGALAHLWRALRVCASASSAEDYFGRGGGETAHRSPDGGASDEARALDRHRRVRPVPQLGQLRERCRCTVLAAASEGVRTSSDRNDDLLSFIPARLLESSDYRDTDRLGVVRRREAAVVFADVTGSTAISELLGRAGSAGTEQFSRILNDFFAPVVDIVHSHDGELAQFSGDAVTAVFLADPGDRTQAAARALRCAFDIRDAVEDLKSRATTAGAGAVSVSVGVAYGDATSTVVGDPDIRLEHVIAGPALELCLRAEQHARDGDVVAERWVLVQSGTRFDERDVVAIEADSTFVRVMEPPAEKQAPTPGREARGPRRPPADVAAFLNPGLIAAVESGRSGLLDEHRRVTSVFCRFEPSTSDGRVPRALQQLTVSVVRVIARFGGFLHRVDLGGDRTTFIVLFGAPVAHEDDESRAIAFGLEVLRHPDLPAARVGVSSGVVFCGLIGSPARRQYTVLGDAINVAARLMRAAEAGQLLASEPTRRRAGGAWRWQTHGRLLLRGRSAPVEVYQPERSVAQPAPAPVPRALTMVNREAELQTARFLLERARRSAGAVLAVTGKAGMGKTRLLDEIVRLAGERGFRVHRSSARPYGADGDDLAWRGIWASLLELTRDDGAYSERDVRDRLEELEPGLSERAPLVAAVLDLPGGGGRSPEGLPPEWRGDATHEALTAVLRRRQEETPLLLAIEDVQWLNRGSRLLLEQMAAELTGLRVLLVVTQRTGDLGAPTRPEAGVPPGATELALGDLRATELAEIVRLKHSRGPMGTREPSHALVDAVIAKAQGNPLYAEELVSLVDGGTVVDPEAPESLKTLITGRIDALAERDRAVLKVASVIGRRFSASWLWAAYPPVGTPEEVARSLARLARLDLVRMDLSESPPTHVFKHALIQEVAYETLAISTRETLHASIAGYVARTQDQKRREVLDLLAHHYSRSSDRANQRHYLRRAGDAARSAYANDSAIAHYRSLLPLLDDDERGDVLIDLGDVLQLSGAWSDAESCYREALATPDAARDPSCVARGRAALGRLLAHTKDYPEAVRWLDRARADLDALGQRREAMSVLEQLAYVYFEQGDYVSAQRWCEEHLSRARAFEDQGSESTALETLGLIHWHRGDLVRGRLLLEEAIELAAVADHKLNLVHALNDLAGVLVDVGLPAESAERLAQALALARDLGYRRFAGVVMANAAELHRRRGEFDPALQCLAQALEVFAPLGDVYGLVLVAGCIGMIRREQGQLDEAERLLDLVIAVAGTVDNRPFLCDALLEQARVQLARNRTRRAQALAESAGELAEQISHREVALEARLLLARLSPGPGAQEVEKLLDGASGDAERASVLYVLWRVSGHEDAGRRAADLYRAIATATGDRRARHRYTALTREELPAPGSLPRIVDTTRVPITPPAELVVRAGEALRRLGPNQDSPQSVLFAEGVRTP
jgi:class 3 adenylate cyclase/tetratricopeptide (TPR) repeat protein